MVICPVSDWKTFLIWHFIDWPSFNIRSFFFLKKLSNMCFYVVWLIHDIINFTINLWSSSQAMADRRKKRRREKYKNLNFLGTKEAFQMKKKLKSYHLVKKKEKSRIISFDYKLLHRDSGCYKFWQVLENSVTW